jgi:uncharacterized lipoprotein YmbA
MKLSAARWRQVSTGLLCLLVSGCLFKPTTVKTRSFVLAPRSAGPAATAPTDARAIGVGLVKLPPYLLRSSMAVRKDPHEVEYLEASLWADRLDGALQRTLAANLAVLLPTDRIRLSTWANVDVDLAVFVSVEQFDVDAQGRGTLIAWWRITTPSGEKTLKNGVARLQRPGPSPYTHPEAIADTLSELAAELSETLAAAIREISRPEAGIK